MDRSPMPIYDNDNVSRRRSGRLARDTHAFPATPPAGTPAAVRYNACPRGGAHLPLRERARGADAADVVESHGMRFRAPASVRRRSEEHTSELQSLMRSSYAVFCLKK